MGETNELQQKPHIANLQMKTQRCDCDRNNLKLLNDAFFDNSVSKCLQIFVDNSNIYNLKLNKKLNIFTKK